ncbi:MAG: glycosyltransferase, partial [Ignavibacteriales bacterium]
MNIDFKKILMTTDNLGGIWTYTMELLSEIDKKGIKTALAIMGAPLSANQKKQLSAFKNIKVYFGDFKLEWMEDPWEDIDEAGEWLLNIRDEFHPDIIHLSCFSFASLNWGVPVVTVAHSDVISWWRAVIKHPHPKRLNEYFKRVQYGLENSTAVVAPSKSMMKNINEIYGSFKNEKVIYNGRCKPKSSIRIKEKMIFSLGKLWDTAKNISVIVNAAPMLKWKVRIAGNLLNQVAEEFSIHGNVDYVGNLTPEKVFENLDRASVFVLPAKYEPFGLSPLEAGLCGCALVLGDIDSFREI